MSSRPDGRLMVWYKPATWRMDPKWPVLSGLPTIPFRALFLSAIDALTLLWMWHTTESMIHAAINTTQAGRVFAPPMLVLEIQIAWLAFLAGAHGFAFAGYRIKRNTSWDGNVEEDRGGSSESGERPMVNPASVRASNQAKMQGSGTTADAPAIAVPAEIVPVAQPVAAPAAQVATPIARPVAKPVARPVAAPPANVEATEGGTAATPEGAGDATAAGDAFEEGSSEPAAPLPEIEIPPTGGFRDAVDRGKPGKAEPPNSVRAAPLANFPTQADD